MTQSPQSSMLARRLPHPAIRALTRRVAAVQGVDLGQGTNRLSPPLELIEAAFAAMLCEKNGYAPEQGIQPLREATARSLLDTVGLSIDPDRQIVITCGATGGLYCALLALADADSEVLLIEPYYGYHLSAVVSAGAQPRFVRSAAPRWTLELEAIQQAITSRTRILVLCNPWNPTGRVFHRDELQQVLDFCRGHGITIISDDVYAGLAYDEVEYVPISALPGGPESVVTISSFSKAYAITGWRLGYVYGRSDIIDRIARVHDALYVCAPQPFQWALATVLPRHARHLRDIRLDLQRRRDTVGRLLSNAGFAVLPAEGTFYLMASYKDRYGEMPSSDACARLLNEAGIGAVPASTFYHNGFDPMLLRFCYAVPDRELARLAVLLNV